MINEWWSIMILTMRGKNCDDTDVDNDDGWQQRQW